MRWKRLLALAGVILILSMYVIALISAFSNSPDSKLWLMAAVISTVIIPAILYAASLVIKLLRHDENGGGHGDDKSR